MNPSQVHAASSEGLGAAFLRQVAQAPGRLAVLDGRGTERTHGEFAARALALREVLLRALQAAPAAPRVGVCLPPGEAGALVNLALAMTPHASVNLNALAGPASLRLQIGQSGVRRVITSRAAFEALGGAEVFGERLLAIEDLLAGVTQPDQQRAAAVLAEGPERAGLELPAGAAVATLLFSSGSTARPKAIQLSHANVLSNARAVAAAFEFGPEDRLLGVLPFFHSFGYTVTLWAPLLAGASVVFHDNALDARAVGALAEAHRPTVLLATPALYQAWMRRIEPEQLSSVRAAVVGAQRLQPALADAWRARYGGELYEGYGCTELSPVVAANLPDRPGEVRRRMGTVGRPLAGVEVEIRDPRTGQALPPDVEGDLWVRGPNVMVGYLDDETATRGAVIDGWYDTQDVARRDDEGFLTLTDRRSRFTKIGGEMVSHGAVESALTAAAVALGEPAQGVGFAVTSLTDEARGERLAVLHMPLSVGIEAVLERARHDGLANLFTPRAKDGFEVEALPSLASGKLDLVRVKQIAKERAAALDSAKD